MQSDEGTSPAVIAFPQSPDARLRVALRQLDAALAEQRQAVATFRREVTALGSAVNGLGDSTAAFQLQLSSAAADTQRAQDAATRLLTSAEAMGRLN